MDFELQIWKLHKFHNDRLNCQDRNPFQNSNPAKQAMPALSIDSSFFFVFCFFGWLCLWYVRPPLDLLLSNQKLDSISSSSCCGDHNDNPNHASILISEKRCRNWSESNIGVLTWELSYNWICMCNTSSSSISYICCDNCVCCASGKYNHPFTHYRGQSHLSSRKVINFLAREMLQFSVRNAKIKG